MNKPVFRQATVDDAGLIRTFGPLLFVLPEHRGKGFGKALLQHLAQIAVERHCGRMEWVCLDWNQPSIDFYKAKGAVPMDDWTIYRLTGERLTNFANAK